jgi:hypothetical protein
LLGCGGSDVVLGDGRDAASVPPRDAGSLPLDAGSRELDAEVAEDASKPRPDVPRFAEPVAIGTISSEGTTDDDPSLTADRLLLYFNSKRDGGLGHEDIWQSERANVDDPWPEPTQVTDLNTDQRETGIALSADGLSVFWSSDRDGGQGGLDVYGATRASRADAWSEIAPVAALNGSGDELVSALSGDGRTLMLARRDDGDDDYDLYVATRDDQDEWNAPAAIAELNSDDEESDGFLLDDDLQLIFSRDENLNLARRPAPDDPFADPQPLETLNSDGDDRDAWASDDLGYVIFSSDRSGSYLLYEATRE